MAELLVIDDQPELLGSMCDLLEAPGRRVKPADTVEAARQALATGKWDVVVVDLRLEDPDDPTDISGYRLAMDVLQQHSGTEVILVTSYPETQVEDVPVGVLSKARGVFAFVPRGTAGVDFPGWLRLNVDLALGVRGLRSADARSVSRP